MHSTRDTLKNDWSSSDRSMKIGKELCSAPFENEFQAHLKKGTYSVKYISEVMMEFPVKQRFFGLKQRMFKLCECVCSI